MPVLACWLAVALAGPWVQQQALPAWEADWQAGRREVSVDGLQQQLRQQGGDSSLVLLLAQRQLQIHRFAAALATAGELGPEGRSIRARAHYLLGHLEPALAALDPEDSAEVLMLVDIHEMLGHGPETEAALVQARAVLGANHPDLASAEGRAAARAGDHEAALAAFRRALAVDPDAHSAWFGLGRSLLQLGRRDEATAALARHHQLVPLMDQRDHALRAIDLAPLHSANHAQLGDVERSIGRLDRAEAAYRRAAELAVPAELTPVLLRHARLLSEDRGETAAAVALLDDAARITADVRLLVRAGDLLLADGQAGEALARYDAALQLRPGDSRILARRREALAARDAPADSPP